MKLIEGWRHAWRYWSVKLNALGLLLLSVCQFAGDAWGSMPPDMREALPYAQHISIGIFVAGLFARLVAQPRTQEKIDAARK